MAKRAVVISLFALAVLVTVLLVGRSTALQTERTLRAEVLERNATIVTQEARIQRLRADSVTNMALLANKAVLRSGVRVDTASARLVEELASAKTVLADMDATAEMLRLALGRTVVRAESLVTEVTFYRSRVDTLLTLVAAEREARRLEGLAYDKALVLKDSTIAAWKDAATCKVLFFKCPTRTQVVVLTAATTYFIVRD